MIIDSSIRLTLGINWTLVIRKGITRRLDGNSTLIEMDSFTTLFMINLTLSWKFPCNSRQNWRTQSWLHKCLQARTEITDQVKWLKRNQQIKIYSLIIQSTFARFNFPSFSGNDQPPIVENYESSSLRVPNTMQAIGGGQAYPGSTRTGNKRFTFDPSDIQGKRQLQRSQDIREETPSPHEWDTKIRVYYDA